MAIDYGKRDAPFAGMGHLIIMFGGVTDEN